MKTFISVLFFISFLMMNYSSVAQYDKMRFKPIKENKTGAFACKIKFDGYDNELQVDKKECYFEKMLGYTQPSVQRVAPDLELISIYGRSSFVNKHYFLDLLIDIKSVQAKNNYGALFKDSKVKIHFINNEFIYLTTLKTAKGKVDTKEENTVYKTSYLLDDYQAKMLKKHIISDIELVWENGLEKYPVENIDLLRRQLICLAK